MTTVEATPTGSDEAQIRQVIDSFIQAVRAKDLNAIMSFYTSNVVAFDILPPLKFMGDAADQRVAQLVDDDGAEHEAHEDDGFDGGGCSFA